MKSWDIMDSYYVSKSEHSVTKFCCFSPQSHEWFPPYHPQGHQHLSSRIDIEKLISETPLIRTPKIRQPLITKGIYLKWSAPHPYWQLPSTPMVHVYKEAILGHYIHTIWHSFRMRKAPRVASSWLSLISMLTTWTGLKDVEPRDSSSA